MSELSYLEKLLDGVEVKWLPLGNVAEIYGGLTGKSKSDFENGNARYVSYKKIFGYLDVNDYSTDYVYISEGERQNKVRYGDVLFTGSSEIADEAGMSSAVTVHFDESVYLNSFSFGIRFSNSIKIKPEFAKYLFRTHFMRSEIAKTASGVTRFNISKSRFKKILVPIICPNDPEKSLAIQSEIVRILDKFTALTAELTAELNMRKKQYNYYRDQLLSFKEGEVEWKTLGEIGDFTYGYAAKAMDSGDARFVRITDINKDGKLSKENPMYVELNEENEKYTLDKNDLLMARTGATFGKTMIFEEDYPAVYAGFLIKLNLNKTIINAKYYWHFAQSDFFWEQANKLVSGGGQPQFNANALKQVRVPIPYPSHPQKSLDEQGRIVDILDKFDAIAASITEGLPREIELRQKQYEYYRDLLLSFPKPETVSK